MIMYSTRARVIGNPVESLEWAHEVAQLASRVSGTSIQVAARVGGHQDILWVSQHDNMADLDTALTKIQQDRKYRDMVKTVLDRKLFEPGTLEASIWRTL